MKESNIKYDAREQWNKAFHESDMPYPAEGVIRIFKGKYPKLNMKKDYVNKTICDIGFGSGRNVLFLNRQGFKVSGIDVTEEIVNKVKKDVEDHGVIGADLRVGSNSELPFEDDSFDYLLSWNACYYMGNVMDFKMHVKEYARVLRSGGYLIASIPMTTSYIYSGSDPYEEGYRIIRNDPFNIRNGAILRMFESEAEIEKEFSSYFKDFVFSWDKDDCFGRPIHLHMFVCQKK